MLGIVRSTVASGDRFRLQTRVIAVAFIGLLTLVPLGGCSMFGGEETASLENPDPPEKMYADADALLNEGSFEDAAKKFEDLERNYPFSNDPTKPYARRSLALAAYAYYKAGMYDDAIVSGRRYTTMHAGTEDAALAHYVIGSSYYDQMQDSVRDQSYTRKAVEEYTILLQQYPQSSYAKQVGNRVRVAQDMLAASEMEVGRFYQKKGNYLAAINRFKTVVVDHQTTRHVEEALMRLTECYLALGILPEAQTAAAILGHNFPNSAWYKDAYALLANTGLQPHENTESDLSKAWNAAIQTTENTNPT
ncbi:MAG: outer membrane protein assembly factor BamD [Hyphomicrobiaceae bacterium]